MHQTGSRNGRDPLEDHQHPAPLLVSTKELARLLKISQKSVRRRWLTGHIPPPVRIGNSVRWRLDIIEAWIAADCPHMDDWEEPRVG